MVVRRGWWVTVTAAVAVVVWSVLAVPQLAYAAELGPTDGVNQPTPTAEEINKYDILMRWGNAMSQTHAKFGALDLISGATNLIRGANWGMSVAAANALWMAVHEFFRFVFGLDLLGKVGKSIDGGLVGLSRLVVRENGSVSVVVVIAIVVAILAGVFASVRAGRGAASWWRRPLGVVALVAVLALMTSGAVQSQRENADAPDGVYRGATWSPTWLLQSMHETMNSLASMAGAKWVDDVAPRNSPLLQSTQENAGDFLCPDMIRGLQEQRNQKASLASGNKDTDRDGYAISDLVTGMWADQALPLYRQAQFGSTVALSDRTYCHLLEMNSNLSLADLNEALALSLPAGTLYTAPGGDASNEVPDEDETPSLNSVDPSTGNAITTNIPNPYAGLSPKGVIQTKVLDPTASNDVDVSLTAWALCQTDDGGASWHESNDSVANDWWKKIGAYDEATACKRWYVDGKTGGDQEKELNIAANVNDEEAINSEKSPAIVDFFNVMHGVNGGAFASFAMASVYAIGSLFAAGTLFVVAVVVLALQLLALVYLFGFLIVLIVGLFRRDGWGMLGKSFAQMLGVQIVLGFTVVLVSLLALMARIISAVGLSIFSMGSIPQVVWTALSPFAAAMLLNLICTKMLHIPSPFSLKGGIAMASAASAVGAGMGAAAGSLLGGRGGAGVGHPGPVGASSVSGSAREALGLDGLQSLRSRMPQGLRRRAQGMRGGVRGGMAAAGGGAGRGITGGLVGGIAGGLIGGAIAGRAVRRAEDDDDDVSVAGVAGGGVSLGGAGAVPVGMTARQVSQSEANAPFSRRRHKDILARAGVGNGRIRGEVAGFGKVGSTAATRLGRLNPLRKSVGTKFAALRNPKNSLEFVDRDGQIRQVANRVEGLLTQGAGSAARRRTAIMAQRAQDAGMNLRDMSLEQRQALAKEVNRGLRRQGVAKWAGRAKVGVGAALVVSGGFVGAGMLGAHLVRRAPGMVRDARERRAQERAQVEQVLMGQLLQQQRPVRGGRGPAFPSPPPRSDGGDQAAQPDAGGRGDQAPPPPDDGDGGQVPPPPQPQQPGGGGRSPRPGDGDEYWADGTPIGEPPEEYPVPQPVPGPDGGKPAPLPRQQAPQPQPQRQPRPDAGMPLPQPAPAQQQQPRPNSTPQQSTPQPQPAQQQQPKPAPRPGR